VLIIPSSWGSQLVGDLYINIGAIKERLREMGKAQEAAKAVVYLSSLGGVVVLIIKDIRFPWFVRPTFF
jgi:hypothetical protein